MCLLFVSFAFPTAINLIYFCSQRKPTFVSQRYVVKMCVCVFVKGGSSDMWVAALVVLELVAELTTCLEIETVTTSAKKNKRKRMYVYANIYMHTHTHK